MGSSTPLLKDNKMAIPSWITVNPSTGSGNKTISITAQRNEEVNARGFSLKVVTAGGVTKEVTITQESKYVAVSGEGILCKINILGAIFTQLGVTAITFGAYMEFTSGDTIKCGTLTLRKGSAGTASTGYLKLASDAGYVPHTKLKGVYIQAYKGEEAWVSGNEITDIKFDYSGDVAPFGLVGNKQNYLPTLSTTKAGFNVDIQITTDCVVEYRGHTYGTFTITKKQDPARWSGIPQFTTPIRQQGVVYTSSPVTVYNVPTTGTLEVYCNIAFINYEEPVPMPSIDATDSEDIGATLEVHPLVTDSANHSIKLEFRLTITDYSKFTSNVDVTYNGSGTDEDPYYGTMCLDFGVKGLDGDYTWSGESDDITVYEELVNSELTLNPESQNLSLEDSVEFEITYINMLGGSITFIPGIEMQDSGGAVYMDTWTGDTSSDPTGKNNSGTIRFSINTNSEASTGTYTFEITGRNNKGETYSATGEVYVS